ncbi:MAG: LamG-like jellyroll fold domain-containing protein [Methanobacteriota archaeon]
MSVNNGTLEPNCPTDSPDWASGVNGSALMFDGFGDNVVIPDQIIGGWNQGSVSTWVSFDSFNSKTHMLACQSCSGNPNSFQLRVDNGNFNTYLFNDFWASGYSFKNSGHWYHVVFVWKKDGSNHVRRAFINGVEVKNTTNSFSPSAGNPLHFYLGGARDSGGLCDDYPLFSLDGSLDEVYVYNVALNATDVLELYNKYNVNATSTTSTTTTTTVFTTSSTTSSTTTIPPSQTTTTTTTTTIPETTTTTLSVTTTTTTTTSTTTSTTTTTTVPVTITTTTTTTSSTTTSTTTTTTSTTTSTTTTSTTTQTPTTSTSSTTTSTTIPTTSTTTTTTTTTTITQTSTTTTTTVTEITTSSSTTSTTTSTSTTTTTTTSSTSTTTSTTSIYTTTTSSTTTSTSTSTTTMQFQPSGVIVNEFSPNTADGNDWIELYNAGSNTVNVGGWVLGHNTPYYYSAYLLPQGTLIEKDNYLTFYSTDSYINLHDTAGEIVLRGSSFTIVDSVTYNASYYNETWTQIPSDVSLARHNQNTLTVEPNPSPGRSSIKASCNTNLLQSGWNLISITCT